LNIKKNLANIFQVFKSHFLTSFLECTSIQISEFLIKNLARQTFTFGKRLKKHVMKFRHSDLVIGEGVHLKTLREYTRIGELKKSYS